MMVYENDGVMARKLLCLMQYNHRRREEAPILVPKCSRTHDGLSRRKKGIVTPWHRQRRSMEIQTATYYGVHGDLRIIEKRTTFDYDKGNDVTQVERYSYAVTLYTTQGVLKDHAKGMNVDQLA